MKENLVKNADIVFEKQSSGILRVEDLTVGDFFVIPSSKNLILRQKVSGTSESRWVNCHNGLIGHSNEPVIKVYPKISVEVDE